MTDLKIAAMASAYKLPIHPHSSMTGLNHAATIHFLAAIERVSRMDRPGWIG
jgi:L-alanine-DL-glutamate epimerase-like enolase superfamily enzyme